MQAEFWHERWQKHEIGFHQASVHPALPAHWAALGVPAGSEVFVPLCGKSLDMCWLADAGHRVLGVELSDIACREFFAEANLAPRIRNDGRFTIYEDGPYRLLCGDVFALTATDLTQVRGVYDRAALVALPPAMRVRYAHLVCNRVPRRAPILLVSFDYEQEKMPGPPHAVPFTEVQAHYADAYTLQVVHDTGRADAPPPMRARGLEWIAEQTIVNRPNA